MKVKNKDNTTHEEGHYPENPPWTMFFDGPLYARYDEFMRNKDFSQILLTSKLHLANNPPVNTSDGGSTKDPNWWDEQPEVRPYPTEHIISSEIYNSVSDDFYKNYKEKEKKRTRRTRAFIVLSLAIIAALALGTALVIHYFFIPGDGEAKVNAVNISFTGNSSQLDNTTPDPLKATLAGIKTNDELTRLLGHLHNNQFRPRHRDKPIFSPDGKIFADMTEAVTEPTRETPTDKDIAAVFEFTNVLKDDPKPPTSTVSPLKKPTTTTAPITKARTEDKTTSEAVTKLGGSSSDLLQSTFVSEVLKAGHVQEVKTPATTLSTSSDTSSTSTTVASGVTTAASITKRTIELTTDDYDYVTQTYASTTPMDPLDFFAMDESTTLNNVNNSIIKEYTTTTEFTINKPVAVTTVITEPTTEQTTTDAAQLTTSTEQSTESQTKPQTGNPQTVKINKTVPDTITGTAINSTGITSAAVISEDIITSSNTEAKSDKVQNTKISAEVAPIQTRAQPGLTSSDVVTSIEDKKASQTMPAHAQMTSTSSPSVLNLTSRSVFQTKETTDPLSTTLAMSTENSTVSTTTEIPTVAMTTSQTLPDVLNHTTSFPSYRTSTSPAQPTQTTVASKISMKTENITVASTPAMSTAASTTERSTVATTIEILTVPTTAERPTVATTTETSIAATTKSTTNSTAAITTETFTAATTTDTSTAATSSETSTAATTSETSTAATTSETSTADTTSDTSTADRTSETSTAVTTSETSTAATNSETSTAATTTETPTAAMTTETSTAVTTTETSTAAMTSETSTAASTTKTPTAAMATEASTDVTTTKTSTTASTTETSTAASTTETSTAATTTKTSTAATTTETSTAATTTETSTAATTTESSTAATTTESSTAATTTKTSTAATTSETPTAATTSETSTAATTTETSTAVTTTETSTAATTTETTTVATTTARILPDVYNYIQMLDVTSFTKEMAEIKCDVHNAIDWKSVTLRIEHGRYPIVVKLSSTKIVHWLNGKQRRFDVRYDVVDNEAGSGSNVTIILINKHVQCSDNTSFVCELVSEISNASTSSNLVVVGRPSPNIDLLLGPSIIEGRALRLTATWQGGYPIPWTNMSWTAVDVHNQRYDLTKYGKFRDYKLQIDHKNCQTRLKHSIVIFPKMNLNATTFTVKPDLTKIQDFVTKKMETMLIQTVPGVEKILVIPLNYCQPKDTNTTIEHPYTKCGKFVRCLPGDFVIQQCPLGTCFSGNRHGCY